MKKNDWKYMIDAPLFVNLCSIAAIGLMMAFVIPSGRGPEASKYFLSLHRHQWGDIHLYLSLFMLALMVLHIWLNWGWVTSFTKNYFGKRWEKALWSLSLAWPLVLIVAWAVMKF